MSRGSASTPPISTPSSRLPRWLERRRRTFSRCGSPKASSRRTPSSATERGRSRRQGTSIRPLGWARRSIRRRWRRDRFAPSLAASCSGTHSASIRSPRWQPARGGHPAARRRREPQRPVRRWDDAYPHGWRGRPRGLVSPVPRLLHGDRRRPHGYAWSREDQRASQERLHATGSGSKRPCSTPCDAMWSNSSSRSMGPARSTSRGGRGSRTSAGTSTPARMERGRSRPSRRLYRPGGRHRKVFGATPKKLSNTDIDLYYAEPQSASALANSILVKYLVESIRPWFA